MTKQMPFNIKILTFIFVLMIFFGSTFMLIALFGAPDLETDSTTYPDILTVVKHFESERYSDTEGDEDLGEEKKQSSGEGEGLSVQIYLQDGISYDPVGEDPDITMKRNKVREMFVHAYGGYESRCFGKGEVKAESGGCHEESYASGLQISLVDSLDTMLIMGLDDYYIRARNQVRTLDLDQNKRISVFESNVRLLGGLLSAYSYTHDDLMLDKAIQLGDKLLNAFNTESGIPKAWVNLQTGSSSSHPWTGGASTLSEIGTLQLEFTYLSHVSGYSRFAEKAINIFDLLHDHRPADGLYPLYINTNTFSFKGNTVSAGGLGDSFYEYLLKLWLLTGKRDEKLGKWFFQEAQDLMSGLGKKKGDDMYYLVQKRPEKNEMEHLTCFAGGMFALGSLHTEDKELSQRMLDFGKGMGKFCYEMYAANPTGLSGESCNADSMNPNPNGRHYLMRPEAVETWFILWRVTKDPIYREWGWNFYQSIEQHTKGPYGYSGVRDVTSPNPVKDDVQQSWFLAETTKYLFLLFTPDDVLPLDKYVFSTEGHPFPIEDIQYFMKQ